MGGKRKPDADPAQRPLCFAAQAPAVSQSGEAPATEKAAKEAKTSADSQAGAKPSEPAPKNAKAEAKGKAKGKAAKAEAPLAAAATATAEAAVKASKTQAPAATEQSLSDTKAAAAAKAQPKFKGAVPAASQAAAASELTPALALPKAGQTPPPVHADCVERDALAEAAGDSDSEATQELPGAVLQRAADDFCKAEQEARPANTAEASSPAKGFEAQPKRTLPSPALPADPVVSRASAKTESADSPYGVLEKPDAQSLAEDRRGEALLRVTAAATAMAKAAKLPRAPDQPQSKEEAQSEDNFGCSVQRPQANQAGSETVEKDSAASQGGPLQEDKKLQPQHSAGENPSQPSMGAVNGDLVREEPLSTELPADNTALGASAKVDPAASQEPATETPAPAASLTEQEKKNRFYDDPATELVFRLSKQLKTVESDVEADRVFQQAKAACEQHPLFRQWVREVHEEVNCEDGLEEEERWVVWEQEPDEDFLCFRCFLKRQAGLPECSSDGEVSVTSEHQASQEVLGTGRKQAADDFCKAEQANTAEASSPAKGFETQAKPKRTLSSPTLPADPAVGQASAKTAVSAKSETDSLLEDLHGEALLRVTAAATATAEAAKLQRAPDQPQSKEEAQSEDNFGCSVQRPQANQAGSETVEKDSAASQGGPLQEDEKLQPQHSAGENPSQPSMGAANGDLVREEPLSTELPADHTALGASAKVDPAASQEPATETPAPAASLTEQEKKKRFYDDPATELVFRLSKQLKTVESDVEADRVFQQAKAACEQHPLFRQWVREVHEEVNCEDGLEEEERWVVWEQEPDEDFLCFRCFLKRQAGLPECSSDGEVSVTSEQEASVEQLLRAIDTVDSSSDEAEAAEVSQFRRNKTKKRTPPKQTAPPSPADSWEQSDKEVLSPCLEKLHEPEGFKRSVMWQYLQQAWSKLTVGQKRRVEHNVTKLTHDGFGGRLSVGTFCSGTGMGELAHRCLTASLKSSEDFLFSCEKEPFKAKHLQQTVHPLLSASGSTSGSSRLSARGEDRLPASERVRLTASHRDRLPATAADDACVFKDMAEACEGKGLCWVHDKTCDMKREPFIVICGYSCKNLSKLNPCSKETVLRSATGSSGETANALLAFLKNCRPPIALLENVEEMGKEADVSDNVSFFFSELDNLGYAMATKVMDSIQYGVPQVRKRAWQVLLNRGSFAAGKEELDEVAQEVMRVASSLSVGCPHMESFLLDVDDEYLQAELERRKKASGKSPGTQDQWKGKHREFFQNKGVPWTALQVPAAVKASPWCSLLTEREREILAWALMYADQKEEEKPAASASAASQASASAASQASASAASQEYVAVDVSQRLDRCRIVVGSKLFTILPGQKVYLVCKRNADTKVGNGRLLSGKEALSLQAYPGSAKCTDPQQQDLAGNAFTGTVVLALLLGIYSCLPEYAWTDENLSDAPVAESRKRKGMAGSREPEALLRVCRRLSCSDSDS